MTSLKVIRAAACAMAVLVSGSAVADEKVVRIYNWADYVDLEVLKDFTKETGIK